MHADWHPDGPRPATDAADEDETPPAAHPHATTMHAWFAGVGNVRDALIAGDLDAVGRDADTLVTDLDEAQFPAAWRDSVAGLRTHAAAAADADSLDTAAVEVAAMADACGGCHAALEAVDLVEQALPPDEDVPEGTTTPEIMARHGFGATRMWEGIVAPSPRRWIRGTTMFVITPDCVDTPPAEGSHCARTRALARRAHLEDDRPTRTALYGELLATCADCHTKTRGR